MKTNLFNDEPMCSQRAIVDLPDGLGAIRLIGKQRTIDPKYWDYSLHVITVGFTAQNTNISEVNLDDPNQPCGIIALNCLTNIIRLDFTSSNKVAREYLYNLGFAEFQPCCPEDSNNICLNCNELNRQGCISVSPNKTPIKLDLEIQIYKNGTNKPKRKIPYDKARHDG